MPGKLSRNHLLLVSKGNKQAINHFRLGVQLTSISGRSVDELVGTACRDRFIYARETLKYAMWALEAEQPHYRIALARAYYAMYHAIRAVVYFVESGDDHEAHSELPKHIPSDFPDRQRWENDLKAARFERNRADYDPYPRSDGAFKSEARYVVNKASELMLIVRRYLILKGCAL